MEITFTFNNFAKCILKESIEIKSDSFLTKDISSESQTTDPNFTVELTSVDRPGSVMPKDAQWNMVRAIYAIPNNVWRMSSDMENLTETSSNLARVMVKNGEISIETLQRSSVESQKWDIANGVRASLEMMGADVEHSGSYPGWTPKPSSPIVGVMGELYQKMSN